MNRRPGGVTLAKSPVMASVFPDRVEREVERDRERDREMTGVPG